MRDHEPEATNHGMGGKRREGGGVADVRSKVCCWLMPVALMLCTLGSAAPSAPGQSKPSEYSVKAAYLLNFGKFIRNGAEGRPPRGTFEICVIGQDQFGRSLDEITTKESIDGRLVRVSRLTKVPESEQCDVAFISTSEGNRIEQDVAALSPYDTLTVSDAPDFLEHGGMIQFLLISNHVRFAVNLEAIRRTHLVLSSELLRVAASVTGNSTSEVLP